MHYRLLGTTGINVSEIAIGCSGYWGNKRYSSREAERIIFEAFDLGVNFFDTGHNYCNFNAEPRLGSCIKKLLSRCERDQLVISTKAGTVVPSAPIIPSDKRPTKNFSAQYIEDTVIKCIQNLNCDYLDIFQLHGISASELTPELIDAVIRLKSSGLIRSLGINTHSISDMFFIAENSDLIDMALIDYNLIQLDREPAIDAMAKAGVGVVAGTVLAQGHLIKGKIGRIRRLGDLWYLARALLKPSSRRLAEPAKRMQEILLDQNLSAAQIAFAFVLANPQISSCVFGTTNLRNLHEVVSSTGVSITETMNKEIRAVFAQLDHTHSG